MGLEKIATAKLKAKRAVSEKTSPDLSDISSADVSPRTFTQKELNLLLRRADYLERENLFAVKDAEKETFTLEETREIAEEIGITPGSMEEALRYSFPTTNAVRETLQTLGGTASPRLMLEDHCQILQGKIVVTFPDFDLTYSQGLNNWGQNELILLRQEKSIVEKKRFLRRSFFQEEKKKFPLVKIGVIYSCYANNDTFDSQTYFFPSKESGIAVHVYNRSILLACAPELAALKDRWSPFVDKYFNVKLIEK